MRINEIRPNSLAKGQKDAYKKDLEFYQAQQQGFIERACPGCGELREFEFDFIVKNLFTYFRCKACWSIFMNPGPTKEMISIFYEVSENYKFFSKCIYPVTRENRKKSIHQSRATLVNKRIDELKKINSNPISILEIGAGDGSTLSLIKEQNPNIASTALEPNLDSILSGSGVNKNIRFVQSSFESFTTEIERFDFIICFEVIEHLLHPEEVFKFVKRNLKPHGYFIFTTPNAHSVEINLLKEKSTSVDIEHISLLTPLSVHNLAVKNNFKVEVIEDNGLLDMDLIRHGLVGKNILRRLLIFALFKVNFQRFIKLWNISSNMSCVLKNINS